MGQGSAMSAAAGYMAFTLYVGAAMHDANGDQKRLMQTKLPPLISRAKTVTHDPDEWRLVAESILINVQRIMGPEWRPIGEWAERIDALLKEKAKEQ
jgi:hypothetical protein